MPKHEKHLRLLRLGTKLIITFEFKGFFDIRREAQSFYADFSIYPPPITCAPDTTPQRARKSQPSSSKAGLNSAFSQISAHASGA